MQALSGEFFQAPVYPDWGILGKSPKLLPRQHGIVCWICLIFGSMITSRQHDVGQL